jgi:negative regulator of flagellin synthesis FlgM
LLSEICAVTNKIDGYKSTQIVPQPAGKARAAGKVGGDSPNTATTDVRAVDQLTLTQSARTLQKLAEAVSNAPVVDSKKIEAIKRAVEQDQYKVDSRRVAGKLIAFEHELK